MMSSSKQSNQFTMRTHALVVQVARFRESIVKCSDSLSWAGAGHIGAPLPDLFGQPCNCICCRTKWAPHCRFPDNQRPDGPRPDLNLYLAKYFSLAAVGITSGFWVW